MVMCLLEDGSIAIENVNVLSNWVYHFVECKIGRLNNSQSNNNSRSIRHLFFD